MFNRTEWMIINKKKVNAYYSKYKNKTFFGGNRDIVLERDGYKCVKCGISRDDHKLKYGRDITVDHIDGQGSTSKVQNNSLNNLQTLCFFCHMVKDKLPHCKLNQEIASEIKGCYRDGLSISQLARIYKVSNAAIHRLISGKTWGRDGIVVEMRPSGRHRVLWREVKR